VREINAVEGNGEHRIYSGFRGPNREKKLTRGKRAAPIMVNEEARQHGSRDIKLDRTMVVDCRGEEGIRGLEKQA
jgi:hypothetical protein